MSGPDEAPFVELEDPYGEDYYVGLFSNLADDVVQYPTTITSNATIKRKARPKSPEVYCEPDCSDDVCPVKPVSYTPRHPSQMRTYSPPAGGPTALNLTRPNTTVRQHYRTRRSLTNNSQPNPMIPSQLPNQPQPQLPNQWQPPPPRLSASIIVPPRIPRAHALTRTNGIISGNPRYDSSALHPPRFTAPPMTSQPGGNRPPIFAPPRFNPQMFVQPRLTKPSFDAAFFEQLLRQGWDLERMNQLAEQIAPQLAPQLVSQLAPRLTPQPTPQLPHQAVYQQAPPKRPPLPPSEDEIAKQDLEADANHDEEYHEVETYADYIPAKLKVGLPHPDPVVETSSLSTVEPPDINYELKLPAKIVNNGLLSALQLESITYACQQHNQLLADGVTRKGFLIGDGAGVGKGRTIAGIIYENFLRGRKKSIWLSVSTDLKLDAERDFKDIGAKIPVHLLGKFTYGRRIDADFGVVFSTYSGLVSKSQSVRGNLGTRLGQLVTWAGAKFDGVIIFDECHKAKNIAMGKNKKQHSKAAEFALEIQRKLPNSRVVYASATGASETKHLGYMNRLGIWGFGTAYRDFGDFCASIEKRGVGAMELVAVDLKMRGSYIARQLSFKTTSFEIRIATLENSFVQLYDQCVDMWAKAYQSFSEAADKFQSEKKRIRTMWASFWAAHQKFFKYLCIGAKVPLVIEIAEKAMQDGKCVVIGLQSTGESKTMEALEDGDINEFISTARATFESLIENHFPAPYQPRRARRRVSPIQGSSNELIPSSSSSSSTAIDESWHSHDVVKFMVDEGGLVKAALDEAKIVPKRKKLRTIRAGSDKKISKNQQVLNDIAEEKRSQARRRSARAVRAKRRAQERGQTKSRIKLLEADSDSEYSNPLSSSSSEARNNLDDSDESYDCSGSGDESSSDSSATLLGTDVEELANETKHDLNSNHKLSSKMEDDDSSNDIQITAVKPSRNYEVIILSSDDDDLDDELDSDDPMREHGTRLAELRDELYKLIDDLGPSLPNNTLDDLIDRLGGPSKVAEMTGRKGRLIKDDEGKISYKNRNEAEALDNLNIAEKERFMKGQKLIAIISEAASSGISLQADRRVANQRRRVHITIELPWSADRAIQQFGRTHRSNQVCGPEYVFIISELAGEKRFASIVAKRLESLGALTHGDRRATTDSRDLSQFNIFGRYCKQALEYLFNYIESEITPMDIKPSYNPSVFIKEARQAFIGVGLAHHQSGRYFSIDNRNIDVSQFLNRLLGMRVRVQNAMFKLFTDYMDRIIVRRKVSGLHDSGILELNSESGKTRCCEPEVFHLSTLGGVVKCTLHNVQVERGLSWGEAMSFLNDQTDSRSGFYTITNPLTKAKMVILILREPSSIDLFRAYKPNTGRQPKAEDISFLIEKAVKVTPKQAENIWCRIFELTNTHCVHMCFFNSCKRLEAKMRCDVGLRHRNYCILSGGILTAWPYLEKTIPEVTKNLRIVRLRLDASNRVIGPIVPQYHLDQVRKLLRQGEKNGIDFEYD